MRAAMFSTAIILGAGCALAQDTTADVQPELTLTNGCVYAPSITGEPDAWDLIHIPSSTLAECAGTIYGQRYAGPVATIPVVAAPEQAVSRTAPAPDPIIVRQRPARVEPRQRQTIALGYVVGVFR